MSDRPRYIRQRFSGKIMEIWREDDYRVIYQLPGSNGLERWAVNREFFAMKWEYYHGPFPPEPEEDAPADLDTLRDLAEAPKRKRGRPKGSKNKAKAPTI